MRRSAPLLALLLPLFAGCGDTDAPYGPAGNDQEEPPADRVGLLVFASQRDGNEEIYVMRDDGTALQRLTDHRASDVHPSWSPDGSRIVFQSERAGTFDLWVVDADGTNLIQITSGPDDDSEPDWSPDGSKIVFSRSSGGGDERRYELHLVNPDGTGLRRITEGEFDLQPEWAPDGGSVAFSRLTDAETGFDLYEIDVATGRVRALVTGPYADVEPAWSPSGSRLAYVVIDNWWRVHTADADGSNARLLVDQPWNSILPRWSPDAQTLAFVRYGQGVLREIYTIPARGGEPLRLTEGMEAELLGDLDWIER